MSNIALSQDESRQFIDEWFLKLDVHAPVDEVLSLIADNELVMKVPETTIHGHEGFKQWYSVVTSKFFDEVHSIKALRITPQEQIAKVEMILLWEGVSRRAGDHPLHARGGRIRRTGTPRWGDRLSPEKCRDR